MFTAKVYTVMIGSLSGMSEEIYAAKEVIRKWNQQYTVSTGKLFMPVEWTTNPEVLQKVDVVIGIVGNYIDNHAFIEECLESEKQVLLFFNAFIDPKNTIQSEHDEVKAFRERIQSKCICFEYSDINGLIHVLNERLLSC